MKTKTKGEAFLCFFFAVVAVVCYGFLCSKRLVTTALAGIVIFYLLKWVS